MSIVKRVLNLVVKSSSAKLDINALVNNEQFKNVNREFAANCRDFCERNYENTSALSDLDCMLITMELCTNGAKQQVLKKFDKKGYCR